MSGQIVAVHVPEGRIRTGGSFRGGTASIRFQVHGIRTLTRALERMGDDAPPFLMRAMKDIGQRLETEIRVRGRPSIVRRIEMDEPRFGRRGKGVWVWGAVVHPAAAVFEFGRQWWWRARPGMRVGNNRPWKRGRGAFYQRGMRIKYWPGWRGEPYVGIRRGDLAIGATRPYAIELLQRAVQQEWERIGDEIEAEEAFDAA